MSKNGYHIPTMKQIRRVKENGLTVVSTFTGCGGSCLGFKMEGCETLWVNEFIQPARETYEANFPGVPIDPRDVREIEAKDILHITGLKRGEIDIMEGSPPCASFSTSGKRERSWGEEKGYSETRQRTDDLFFEFARLVKGVQPKVFVAENVSGLVKGVAKGYFKMILEELRGCGYVVEARLINAQWLGVPQMRERLIFMGVREDLKKKPLFPKPKKRIVTMEEAFASLPPPTEKELEECSMVGQKIAEEWDRLGKGGHSNRRFNLWRTRPDRPCPTVVQSGGNVGLASVSHWAEPRKFTIRELRRICGFPDDFILTGTYKQQWERLGRAVPPPLMAAMARCVKEILA